MRGHLPLIAMRQRRQRPTFVSVDVGEQPKWLCDHWHELGLKAYILVEPSDPVERLDLRFLVKLTMHFSAHVDDAERARKVFDACIAAGADRVIGGLHRIVAGQHETVELFDSAGVLQWLE